MQASEQTWGILCSEDYNSEQVYLCIVYMALRMDEMNTVFLWLKVASHNLI